ncbi:MAG: hypothetical protein K2X66_05745, partial [Cyanobacteria bacterium]|nr:hypothetical protein [Cyanobacteriota bacterium]
DLLATLMTQFFGESGNTQKLALFTIFSPYLLGCVDFLKEQGFQCGYWCLDDWSEMNWPLVAPGTENKLVEAMDFTLATNGLLSKKIESLTGKPCPTVANGFSQENFSRDSELTSAPSDLLKGEELTFIYWGNLANQWIDWPLLQGIVEGHPEWAFNLIGFFPPDRPFPFPENLTNVKFLGMKPVHTLSDYGRASDIGFIHFENSPLIQSVNPVKAYEYLACGLPIISSVIPDLDAFPNTFQVTSPQGFEEAVRKIQDSGLLKHRDPEKVKAFLEKSTWKSRAQKLLEQALPLIH